MKYAKTTMYTFSILVFLSFGSCDKKELGIQQDFPFEVTLLPVPREIGQGERVEMRFEIRSEGKFDSARYWVRYFQFKGMGTLQLGNEPPFKLNDLYELPGKSFRLYYTSKSNVSQSFDLWIADQFHNEKHFSIQFDPAEGSGGVPGITGPTGKTGPPLGN